MGEVSNQLIDLSPIPTPLALDFYEYLDCKPIGCHVILFFQPPSSSSFDPLNFSVMCSSVPDSTCDFHEDKVVEGVGIEKPTCAIIFYEYVWESEEEVMVKDDCLLSAPHSLSPNIFCDSATSYFLVKVHPQMCLLLIIYRTHRMLVHHLIMDRTDIPL